jgi:hypothetical protein
VAFSHPFLAEKVRGDEVEGGLKLQRFCPDLSAGLPHATNVGGCCHRVGDRFWRHSFDGAIFCMRRRGLLGSLLLLLAWSWERQVVVGVLLGPI